MYPPHLTVPPSRFNKFFQPQGIKDGITEERRDKLGRRRCYREGVLVECPQRGGGSPQEEQRNEPLEMSGVGGGRMNEQSLVTTARPAGRETIGERDFDTVTRWGGDRADVGEFAIEKALEGGLDARYVYVYRDENGVLLGLLTGGDLPDDLYVSYVATAPKSGLGRRLMNDFFAEAASQGKGVRLDAKGSSPGFYSKLQPSGVSGRYFYWTSSRVRQLVSGGKKEDDGRDSAREGELEALRERLRSARGQGERAGIRRQIAELTGDPTVPPSRFNKFFRPQGVKAGITEERRDKLGRRRCYKDGVLVDCPQRGGGSPQEEQGGQQGKQGQQERQGEANQSKRERGSEKTPTELYEAGQCCYDPDPTADHDGDGVSDAARVGVPAWDVPPPPESIPKLPNLQPDEEEAQNYFEQVYLEDPERCVDAYRQKRNNVVGTDDKGNPVYEIGDHPKIFNTDDAKLLSPHYNPHGKSKEEVLAARGKYNTMVHQTANALAKRAFLDHLDKEVSQLPEDKRFVLVSAGGVACHGKDTPIVMFDGSLRSVQDVKEGELVMGPDSTPRTVLKTHRGKGMLYRVTPYRGDPFVVNEDHVLSLKAFVHENACGNLVEQRKRWRQAGVAASKTCKESWAPSLRTAIRMASRNRTVAQLALLSEWKASKIKKPSKKPNLKVVNLTVREVLSRSKKFRDNSWLYKTGVEFPARAVPLDPYFLGLWLGDGTHCLPSITSADEEITAYLQSFVKQYPNLKHTARVKKNNKAFAHYLTLSVQPTGRGPTRTKNPITEALMEIGVFRDKHIPQLYLVNSREVRLQLLAGLLDSDGWYSSGRIGFGFSSKHKHLAEQVQFLARSLGFVATMRIKKAANPWTGTAGVYYNLHIGGNDLDTIPTKIARKQAAARPERRSDGKLARNALHTSYKIEPIGVGDFYGFTLDKDHLYLLGDFTVTHNSGKGYALKNVDATRNLIDDAVAVWDAAGEANSTENPWILEECKKRGIKAVFAFIHADPQQTWENPKRGVVERANKIGRMVDARVFADSYGIGAKNFANFMEANKDDENASFFVINNATGGAPQLEQAMPQDALSVDPDRLYQRASQVLEERRGQVQPYVYEGGTVGQRIWGPPAGTTKSLPRYLFRRGAKAMPSKDPNLDSFSQEAREWMLRNLTENSQDNDAVDERELERSMHVKPLSKKQEEGRKSLSAIRPSPFGRKR